MTYIIPFFKKIGGKYLVGTSLCQVMHQSDIAQWEIKMVIKSMGAWN